MKVKEESENVGLKLNIQKLSSWHLVPSVQFSSIQFSSSVMSDSSQPHELQHTGLPVHHQLPESTQTHVH